MGFKTILTLVFAISLPLGVSAAEIWLRAIETPRT